MNRRTLLTSFLSLPVIATANIFSSGFEDFIFNDSFEGGDCPPIFATSIIEDLEHISDAQAFVEPPVNPNCPNIIL